MVISITVGSFFAAQNGKSGKNQNQIILSLMVGVPSEMDKIGGRMGRE